MLEPNAGDENTTTRDSNKIVLFAGIAFLLVILFTAAGVVIANSSTTNESSPAVDTTVSQTLPTLIPPTIKSIGPARDTAVAGPTVVQSASPILLPSLTPIPTSTPTNEPLSPTSTAVATTTQTSTLPVEGSTPTKLPPLPTPVGVFSWTLKVPILMYHYISEPPADADKYRTDLSVSPEAFREQMAYLANNGFETVDLYDLSLAVTAKKILPEKPVILTFDDGYRDNYENAFPILQEHGLSGTYFIVTQPIDDGNKGYMTWDMVEEMADAGMRIEPHSKTHADLSQREREYIIYEVLGSRETIAAHTGQTPRFFCYPGGRYDDNTIQVLADLDFWGAVTTAGGKWYGFNERFEWPRLRMRNTTPLAEFASFVNPGDTISGKPIDS